MQIVSERITNISDHEKKIRNARATSDMLLDIIQKNKYVEAEYLAKRLSLEMHELSDFEFELEMRKINVPQVCE